jgi:hypothetical protein
MPGFVASEQVDDLTYDFSPFGPRGEIPEPSSAQIQSFRNAVASMYTEMIPDGDADQPATGAELRTLINDFIGRDQTEMLEKLLQSVSDVCSGHPSFDELQGLPYRHQQAFTGWITGVFLLPPQPTPATRP